ncbi:MAG TPA: CaiB/BaiF CoA-transferase family protein [Rhodocyclaceae bacterium]|nr:CaiB/BaiF CoA-transferase family protein [Rhodocyclaceae bacterium]
MAGPLAGVRVVEMVGIGPGPFCAMMLADMGAQVIRIDQKRGSARAVLPGQGTRFDVLARGRSAIAVDLKQPGAAELVLRLVAAADALIEGYRPGVMERLGLGPELCLERKPALVYGRMTGWGQTGPLAQAAGHDLNYIALSGALHAMGRPEAPPPPPLNLVGDFGGGGMMLAFGVVCALLEARASGKGQVVDAAMTDGAALLTAMVYGFKAAGAWSNSRGANLLDGGAHFYDSYACADGKYVAIGAIEPQFYALLLEVCGITDPDFSAQMDTRRWPELKAKLAAVLATKTRDQWCALMAGSDVCFAPVLDLDEAPAHPHNRARQTFIDIDGVVQPAPAPRFSRTPPGVPSPPAAAGPGTDAILADWGLAAEEISAMRAAGLF